MPAPPTDELLLALRSAHRELALTLLELRERTVAAGFAESWTARFIAKRILMVARLLARVSREVLGPQGEFGMAGQAVESAYGVGLNVGTRSLLEQGAEAPAAAMEDIHEPAMRLIAQELTDGYGGLYQSILRKERDAYRQMQGRLTQVAMATGETGDELTGRFVREFIGRPEVREGRLRLPGGTRNWRMEDYAEMLGRTVVQKALREASLNRITEAGHDLVLVIGGRIELTCETCLWADGRVFSVSGEKVVSDVPEELWGGPLELILLERSEKRDSILTDYHGKRIRNSPPVGHPRCIHGYGAYIPQATRTSEAAEELRVVVEKYAARLGMDIETGGQAA